MSTVSEDPGKSLSKIDVAPDDVEMSVKQLSQGQLVWRRFRRHPLALLGTGMFLLMVLMALTAPAIQIVPPTFTEPEASQNLPPMSMALIPGNAAGYADDSWYLDGSPTKNVIFPMGTDKYGYSVWSEVVNGARISLLVGVLAAIVTTILGVIIGAIAGFYGKLVDTLLMRLTDIFLSLPALPVFLVLSAFIGSHTINILPGVVIDPTTTPGKFVVVVSVMSIFSWPGIARIVRSYYLTFREREFTEAARAVGASKTRIMFKHILPNILSPIIVFTTLNVAGFIVYEATLDFLSFGFVPPTVTWGTVLSDAQDSMARIVCGPHLQNICVVWWPATFPGIAILLTVLAINFMGDGLRDAFDVRG